MARIPLFIRWLYRLLVLGLFVYIASFYAWIFWELLVHQEFVVFETSLSMNRIEFGIAIGIAAVAVISFAAHLCDLKWIKGQ